MKIKGVFLAVVFLLIVLPIGVNAEVVYQQNFDSGLPGAGQGWTYWDNYGSGESPIAWDGTLCFFGTTANSLSEAVLDLYLPGYTNVVVSFWYYAGELEVFQPLPGSFSGHYNGDGVAWSYDGGTSWTSSGQLTIPSSGSGIGIAIPYGDPYPHIKIKIQNYSALGDESGLMIDNLVVYADSDSGPITVIVPNVVGMAQAAAQSAITSASLNVGMVSTAYSSTVAAGNVISQSPTAGSSVPSGSPVNIVVSLGVASTGSLSVTLAPSGAVTAGAQWRRTGTTTWYNSGTTESGLTAGSYTVEFKSVTGYNTPANQNATITSGSTTTITGTYTVSGVTVPNVVGMTQSAAQTAITTAGLTVGTASRAYSDTIAEGNVISQSPAAGGQVSAGSAVNIVVSLGITTSSRWTWVSGPSAINQAGVYGTKGVPSLSNVPCARRACGSWVDASDNLWLFGGFDSSVYYNDLWKFNGVNWTWVSGSNTTNQYGVYGTKGVAASGNAPGARTGSVSWVDAGGNFWLFGGSGYATSGSIGALNDLWKFDGSNWTWIGGSNTTNQYGIYGTKGVAASGNVPGSRSYCSSWADGNGNLWLFGGSGYAAIGSSDYLNDLWKFDGTNWTWASGSNAVDQAGVYGTKGVAATDNVPGARMTSVSWIDADGNFWLLGGPGYTASGYRSDYLNDLWKFDGTDWTWVGGSSGVWYYGTYGTKGVAAPGNVPGSRIFSMSWGDAIRGNLWLFGGVGYTASSNGYLNDLWKFDGTNWTWVSGSNAVEQNGVYGTKGVPASDNVPGNRYLPVTWTDSKGNLWLFGGGCHVGSVYGNRNDLWKFGIPEHAADLTGDGVVNYMDMRIVADQWCSQPSGAASADISPLPAGDGIVNLPDFAVFAQHWLEATTSGSTEITDGFESGGFMGLPWVLTGNLNWTIVTTGVYEGTKSAKSGAITHSQTSSIELTVNTGDANTISFARKVSSESGYDYLRFYIDGVEKNKWSGTVDWAIMSFAFTPGQHTFKWSYTKDSSVNSGSDCAWIDTVRIYKP